MTKTLTKSKNKNSSDNNYYLTDRPWPLAHMPASRARDRSIESVL